jgi:hypothetical protein
MKTAEEEEVSLFVEEQKLRQRERENKNQKSEKH